MLFLLSFVACGILGGMLARKDGFAIWAGCLIGGLFNVLGLAFLLTIWGAEWVAQQFPATKS